MLNGVWSGRSSGSAKLLGVLWLASFGLGLGGCESGAPPLTLQGVLDEVKNAARGPDGRIQMPLDYVNDQQALAVKPIAEKKLPELKGRGVASLSDDAKTIRVELDDFLSFRNYQRRSDWCWAAAIQISERYMAGDPDLEVPQLDIVKRVYPNPDTIEDHGALSFQIVEALGSAAVREQLIGGKLTEAQGATTGKILNDIIEIQTVTETSTRKLADFLDQFIGTQELTQSLARGEPILVSLGETAEDGTPFRHIYLVYAADVVPISKTGSREALVRGAHAALEKMLRGKGNYLDRLTDINVSDVSSMLSFMQEQRYALRRVYLLDPWKNPGEPDPLMPQIKELSGEEFASRAFFMINQSTSDRILAQFNEQKAKQAQELFNSN
ncbi:MAG: hypothetical protein AAGG38_13945 [Planctomycetota bacterium]